LVHADLLAKAGATYAAMRAEYDAGVIRSAPKWSSVWTTLRHRFHLNKADTAAGRVYAAAAHGPVFLSRQEWERVRAAVQSSVAYLRDQQLLVDASGVGPEEAKARMRRAFEIAVADPGHGSFRSHSPTDVVHVDDSPPPMAAAAAAPPPPMAAAAAAPPPPMAAAAAAPPPPRARVVEEIVDLTGDHSEDDVEGGAMRRRRRRLSSLSHRRR
jgi:hypothetical protein